VTVFILIPMDLSGCFNHIQLV